MLTVSNEVITAFSREARGQAEIDLRRRLIEREPRLAGDPTLPERIGRMIDWAAGIGVTSRFDIDTMADMTFLRGIDLPSDEDFAEAMRRSQPPHECVMLHYLERKPPRFWTAAA